MTTGPYGAPAPPPGAAPYGTSAPPHFAQAPYGAPPPPSGFPMATQYGQGPPMSSGYGPPSGPGFASAPPGPPTMGGGWGGQAPAAGMPMGYRHGGMPTADRSAYGSYRGPPPSSHPMSRGPPPKTGPPPPGTPGAKPGGQYWQGSSYPPSVGGYMSGPPPPPPHGPPPPHMAWGSSAAPSRAAPMPTQTMPPHMSTPTAARMAQSPARPRGPPDTYGPDMSSSGAGPPPSCKPIGSGAPPPPPEDMYAQRRDDGETSSQKSKGSGKESDKDKGRGSYRCGRCGVPKKGHVCPYQPKLKRRPDEPPPVMRNAALQVEMDEFMTVRRLNLEIQGFPESYATAPDHCNNMVVGEPHPLALHGGVMHTGSDATDARMSSPTASLKASPRGSPIVEQEAK